MVRIKGVTQKFSGRIEFEDISYSEYDLLCSIVEKLNSGDFQNEATDGIPEDNANALVGNIAVKEAVANGDSGSISDGVGNAGKETVVENCRSVESIAEIMSGVLDDAKNNPEKYEWRPAPALEFASEHEEFNGISHHLLGRAAEKLGIEKKVVVVNGSGRRMRIYPMKVKTPVILDAVEKAKEIQKSDVDKIKMEEDDTIRECAGWNFQQAQFLKNKRKQVGLSIKELSELINYPFSVIQSWENGVCAPSAVAMKAIEKWFGVDTVKGLRDLEAKAAS